MIPLRVQLKGFLCYKQEQEVAFDGASVWLLAGLNGSGKSAIFDAVTYALFGHHRGGGHDAIELINKDSDKAQVAFEFSLEGRKYQIQRTLQRNKQGGIKTTQQINLANGADSWQAVESTGLQKGFKEWIDQYIGLDYDTFTSSVLLLQGRAEKLLDSTAKGRFEVLAGIVDLDRYERLHKRADEERKGLDQELKQNKARLDALPPVSALELMAAENKIAAADKLREAAQTEWDRVRGLELQALEWAKLQQRLHTAQAAVDQAQKTLGAAADIERKLQRLQELTLYLPRLKDLVAKRGEHHSAVRELADLEKQKGQLLAEIAQLDEQQRQAREQRLRLQKKIHTDEQALERAAAELARLQGLVAKLDEIERHEQERERLLQAVQRLVADPETAVRQAQEQVRLAQQLQQALGPLTRLHTQREELAQALPREKTATDKLREVKQRGETLRADVDRLKPLVEDAERKRQLADQQATRDRTLVEQAQQQLDAFLQTDGAKVCRLCGQALTAAHWQQEKMRRNEERESADKRTRQSAAGQQQAVALERTLREQLTKLEQQLASARETYREQQALARQAREDVERLQRGCAESYQELPLPIKQRVSESSPVDWLALKYPSAADLAATRQQASSLSARERAFEEARDQVEQWHRLQGQLTTVRQGLERMQGDLPRDRSGLRQSHARLTAEHKILLESLTAVRQQVEETQKQIDGLGLNREERQKRLGQVGNAIADRDSTRRMSQQMVEQLRKDLPPGWQTLADKAGLADVNQLRGEQDHLVAERTEERGRELQEARLHLGRYQQEGLELQTQAGKFAAECRQPVEQVRCLGQKAKAAFQARDEEWARVRQDKLQLEEKHRERQELQQDVLKLEEEVAHAKLLADLLGRERLQLHLVRQAERQVVDFANAVLDRLSGGQLYLRLAGQAGGEDSSTKALELEAHNRHTGEKPINVAFLSGSQRFRVAVSLALGIGQYASRQHRPLESVIIDEGFGCLDRFGRQLMIQELHNLRGHLRCILLVSHQDEFADAFADGYRFELNNGSTVATRFQR